MDKDTIRKELESCLLTEEELALGQAEWEKFGDPWDEWEVDEEDDHEHDDEAEDDEEEDEAECDEEDDE